MLALKRVAFIFTSIVAIVLHVSRTYDDDRVRSRWGQYALPVDSHDAAALRRFTAGIREQLGERLVEMRLYGSKARGRGTEESDIDVLVVVERADLETKNAVLDQAFQVSIEEDIFIAPLIIERSRLDDPIWRITDLAVVLERDGILL